MLVNTSFSSFWNWFDSRSWYPLGRVAGGTLYPGLMVTSAVIHKLLWLVNLPVDIRNVCVLLAPGFSGLTALATYLFTREMATDGAGLLAAAFIGIAPGTETSTYILIKAISPAQWQDPMTTKPLRSFY
jgi:dolichyl-diphosphooligosaccharide---protein glycosyltransferase